MMNDIEQPLPVYLATPLNVTVSITKGSLLPLALTANKLTCNNQPPNALSTLVKRGHIDGEDNGD